METRQEEVNSLCYLETNSDQQLTCNETPPPEPTVTYYQQHISQTETDLLDQENESKDLFFVAHQRKEEAKKHGNLPFSLHNQILLAEQKFLAEQNVLIDILDKNLEENEKKLIELKKLLDSKPPSWHKNERKIKENEIKILEIAIEKHKFALENEKLKSELKGLEIDKITYESAFKKISNELAKNLQHAQNENIKSTKWMYAIGGALLVTSALFAITGIGIILGAPLFALAIALVTLISGFVLSGIFYGCYHVVKSCHATPSSEDNLTEEPAATRQNTVRRDSPSVQSPQSTYNTVPTFSQRFFCCKNLRNGANTESDEEELDEVTKEMRRRRHRL